MFFVHSMHITLDQARALDAFAKGGTLQAAAATLHKAHTAVLYALKQLESQSGLTLFDRSGYRTRLSGAGEEVLRHCRALLQAETALYSACSELQSGWEPVVRVVFDAIVPLHPVLGVIQLLRAAKAPTRVQLSVDSLAGVEERFDREEGHVMLSVLPPKSGELTVVPLQRLEARLVAHRDHPLATGRRTLAQGDLAPHVFLTVRGSDPRLRLPTGSIDQQSTVHLSDFHAKKAAITAGIGFGWLPEWLIHRELKQRELVPLRLREGNSHTFDPLLAYRGTPGRAVQCFIEQLSVTTK
jgi:DNA-binding transcriptional LysR family regulator